MLQLNGHLALDISVEAPAQPALEDKGIYFSISRLLFSRELVKEGPRVHPALVEGTEHAKLLRL